MTMLKTNFLPGFPFNQTKKTNKVLLKFQQLQIDCYFVNKPEDRQAYRKKASISVYETRMKKACTSIPFLKEKDCSKFLIELNQTKFQKFYFSTDPKSQKYFEFSENKSKIINQAGIIQRTETLALEHIFELSSAFCLTDRNPNSLLHKETRFIYNKLKEKQEYKSIFAVAEKLLEVDAELRNEVQNLPATNVVAYSYLFEVDSQLVELSTSNDSYIKGLCETTFGEIYKNTFSEAIKNPESLTDKYIPVIILVGTSLVLGGSGYLALVPAGLVCISVLEGASLPIVSDVIKWSWAKAMASEI